jgi:hypothetical protein
MLPAAANGNFSLTTELVSLDEGVTLREWIFSQIIKYSTPDALNGIISNILPEFKETIRMAIRMVRCVLTNSMDLVQSSLTLIRNDLSIKYSSVLMLARLILALFLFRRRQRSRRRRRSRRRQKTRKKKTKTKKMTKKRRH